MKPLFSSEHLTIVDYGSTIYYRMSGKQLSLDIAEQAIESRLSVVNRAHYGLFDYRDIRKVEFAAIKALTSDDAYAHLKASAVVLSGELGAVLGDIYYNMRQPPFHSKYFTDIEAAFSWLEQFEDLKTTELRRDLM